MNILLILTGGTIGTSAAKDGLRKLVGEENAAEGPAEPLLLQLLYDRWPKLKDEASFRVKEPYRVLSEHMTLSHLERLADCLREEDLKDYDGIMITHGSDTLAFTAAFLGQLMEDSPIPVFLLATQLPPEDPESNAVENMLAALELLREYRSGAVSALGQGTSPEETLRPVYVPYRNGDGVMYLHRASELRQCRPGTDDFFSDGMQQVTKKDGSYVWPGAESHKEPGASCRGTENEGKDREREWKVPELSLSSDVLLLHPYVGIRYDCISLSGIRAVVHTLYHSSTAPKELVGFLDRCREAGVTCYILPCDPENYHYETTAELISHGAVPLDGLTEESAYMRLLMKKIQRNA